MAFFPRKVLLAVTSVAMLSQIAAAKTMKPPKSFLAVSMQPDKIAHTLVSVQDEWKAQASLFSSCDAVENSSKDADDLLLVDCKKAPNAFVDSCDTVVSALTQGSSGDRDVVNEYMKDVCGQEVLKGWRQERCQALADGILNSMSMDTYENRVTLDKKKKTICTGMWSRLVSDERAERDKEQKLAEAKAAEDAKRRAEAKAKADAEAKNRAEEEAKAEADAEAMTKIKSKIAHAAMTAPRPTKQDPASIIAAAKREAAALGNAIHKSEKEVAHSLKTVSGSGKPVSGKVASGSGKTTGKTTSSSSSSGKTTSGSGK